MWTFVKGLTATTPLSAIGNMENHFQALLDRFSLGLIIAGKNRKIRYANPKAFKLLDVQAKALQNKIADEVLTPELLRAKGVTVDWLDVPGADPEKSMGEGGQRTRQPDLSVGRNQAQFQHG